MTIYGSNTKLHTLADTGKLIAVQGTKVFIGDRESQRGYEVDMEKASLICDCTTEKQAQFILESLVALSQLKLWRDELTKREEDAIADIQKHYKLLRSHAATITPILSN